MHQSFLLAQQGAHRAELTSAFPLLSIMPVTTELKLNMSYLLACDIGILSVGVHNCVCACVRIQTV